MQCFEQVFAVAEAHGLARLLTASLTHRFMIDFRLRDRAAAELAMQRMEALPPPVHPLSQGLLACYRARLAQVQGQPQVAADLALRSVEPEGAELLVKKLGAARWVPVASPALAKKLAELGADPMKMSPAEFDAMLKSEIKSNADVVKAAGIKVN